MRLLLGKERDAVEQCLCHSTIGSVVGRNDTRRGDVDRVPGGRTAGCVPGLTAQDVRRSVADREREDRRPRGAASGDAAEDDQTVRKFAEPGRCVAATVRRPVSTERRSAGRADDGPPVVARVLHLVGVDPSEPHLAGATPPVSP